MQAAEKLKLELTYEGSVKRVFSSAAHPESLWFDFTDDYSVFDWGKMPDTIANKGKALVAMGAFFLRALEEPGIWTLVQASPHLQYLDPVWREQIWKSQAARKLFSAGLKTHLLGLTDDSGAEIGLETIASSEVRAMLKVARADVHHPTLAHVMNQTVYHYPVVSATSKSHLIPLEVVFRFGMPSGSSLKERLQANPGYAQTLGLSGTPREGEMFSRPVLEFYTKLEPKDRLLSLSEALNISTLSPQQFQILTDKALLAALGLAHLFGNGGIELWDGKFEFIMHQGQVMLADSIGPDELRLIYKDLQLSKEMIRQAYRGSSWEKSLKQAQSLASERGTEDWKAICKTELNSVPEPLPSQFKQKIDQMYGVLANHVTGKEIFPNHPNLESFAASIKGGV